MTVPNEYDPVQTANVLWTDEAVQLWDNLKHDKPVTLDPDAPTPDASPSASGDAESTETGAGTGSTGTETGTDGGAEGATEPAPDSTEIKQAGEEAFTGADTTKVCG
jgi:hypothetical protein